MSAPASPITLAHWRRTIAALYAEVRAIAAEDPARASIVFRGRRDDLFRQHPDSPIPLPQRSRWPGASWYDYDPSFRVVGRVDARVERISFDLRLAADGMTRCTRVARVEFSLQGRPSVLGLYWFEGYGGGLWLPFADATNGAATYGGGRYLYDTIKGADLGATATQFVLDFNFAYNPSCAYEDRWSCPLPPAENRLSFAVAAGERIPPVE